MAEVPDPLRRAQDAIEGRLDELAASLAGRPPGEVLVALERAVRRAGGVTPRRADLSALADRISRPRRDTA